MVRGECIDFDECKKHNGFCHENIHCMNTVGSYSCGCRSGYKFMTKINWDLYINEPDCVDIDECMNRGVCPKKSSCINTDGSYFCQCVQGFEGDLCEDIDECSINSTCDANAACLNMEGSFSCSCNLGYRGDGMRCKAGQCDDQRCPADQKCVSPTSDKCQCNKGLSYNKITEFCEDIDECFLDHDCDQNSTCINLKGSFTCTCNLGYIGDGKTCVEGTCTDDMCPTNSECVVPSKLDCRCKNGYELKSWKSNETEMCVDIDECATMRKKCHEKAVCVNFPGGYECQDCQEGYFGDGRTCFPGSCTDFNCPPSLHQECVSSRSNLCKCTEGYKFNNMSVCVDVDECERVPCDQHAKCSNIPGNFSCACNNGFTADEFGCSCSRAGFTIKRITEGYNSENSSECVDIDECQKGFCHKNANCANNIGSFSCTCPFGYSGDGYSCRRWTVRVLVLNSYELPLHGKNQPIFFDPKGQIGFTIAMPFGKETESFESCSVTYRNRFYVFGGETHKRQISEVTRCELKRIGTLEFDHSRGTCSSIDNREIYLCFGGSAHKKCRLAVEPLGKFAEIASSTHNHRWARTAASSSKFHNIIRVLSFSAELLAVGSYKPGNSKTEVYLTKHGRWKELQDFPFDKDSKIVFCLNFVNKTANAKIYSRFQRSL